MPVENLTPAIEARAVEIQRLLADRSQHRAPSIPDLLIAATAEVSRCIAASPTGAVPAVATNVALQQGISLGVVSRPGATGLFGRSRPCH